MVPSRTPPADHLWRRQLLLSRLLWIMVTVRMVRMMMMVMIVRMVRMAIWCHL